MVKDLTNPLAERPTPLGSLLSAAGRRLAVDLDGALARAGFDDVRASHAPLFMTIDPDGSTATELAQRTHMTKQAMGDLVRHLQRGGYVEVTAAEHDRRARIIRLTERGWQVVHAGLDVINDFDQWLAAEIGASHVQQLRDILDQIVAADWAPPHDVTSGD